jgi:hypothetical protein
MIANDFLEVIKYMPDEELYALHEQLHQRLIAIQYMSNPDYFDVSEQLVAVIQEEERWAAARSAG